MKKEVKDSPAQKDINKFFGIQLRRVSHETTKTNSESNKRRNKKNTT